MANPNFDGIAEPDDTYVDIKYGNPYKLLNLPMPEKSRGIARKTGKKPANDDDRMRDVILQLDMLPDQDWHDMSSTIPDNSNGAPVDDGFVERPLPYKTFDVPKFNKRHNQYHNDPNSNELAAANRGQRWRYNLERSFMLPDSQWNDTVFKGVAAEKPYYTDFQGNVLGGKGTLGGGISTIGNARNKAIMANQWKTFLEHVRQGNFDAYGGTSESAKHWADTFLQRFEEVNGLGSSLELAPMPEILGKRTELARRGLQTAEDNVFYAQNVMDDIEQWTEDGSWTDPAKQNIIKNYLDKVAQALSATLGGDSKSMADAEKIRIQILYLPEQSMDLVKQEIANYRQFLSSVMNYGRQKGWSQNIIGKLNRGKEGLAAAEAANGKGNISYLLSQALSHIGNIVPSLSPQERELAVGLDEALNAGIEAHKNYMSDMVLAADVDPALVYQFASILYDQNRKNYNKRAARYGRKEEYGPREPKIKDMGQLSRSVEPSSFLKPVDYKNLLVERIRPEILKQNAQDNINLLTGLGLTKEEAESVLKNGYMTQPASTWTDLSTVRLK